jgi:hypothetical protein
MANADASTTASVTPNRLNYEVEFFSASQYADAPRSLQSAVRCLEQAYQMAYGVSSLARLLVANDLERENEDDGQPLDNNLRGGLNFALIHLAHGLHVELSSETDRLSRLYKDEQRPATAKKGGA